MRPTHLTVFAFLGLAAMAAATTACGGASSGPAGSAGAAQPISTAGKRVDPATAGTISGKVTLDGPASAPETLRIAVDQTCIDALGTAPKSDAVLVSADGAVQNAFVYIKDTLADYTFDPPSGAVTLDQKGCRYAPRIFGVRVGQPVDIVNSDATFHNIHALPMVNQEFNRGMAQQGMRMQQVFTAPEQMIRFKCDVHAWMTAYAGVMTHPFFATTAADGTFTITGVPPGKYTLVSWHEKFGTRTTPIDVAPSQAVTTNFVMSATGK